MAGAGDLLKEVYRPQTEAELEAVRQSVRGQPFGSEAWVMKTASRLGLETTLRPRGWPKKAVAEAKNGS